jgi:hypothetical protein
LYTLPSARMEQAGENDALDCRLCYEKYPMEGFSANA